jgi:hypothetical protein
LISGNSMIHIWDSSRKMFLCVLFSFSIDISLTEDKILLLLLEGRPRKSPKHESSFSLSNHCIRNKWPRCQVGKIDHQPLEIATI